ncbi:hypothetical protein [Nonomuraea typhae]|uniref:hypothetical protein n=1 Tax=Nonomuraea typhae TaxID=2603600 RepID=UPI0012F8FEB5|nr:hypothetical protein [Nonomuraea typhae]
MERLRQLVGEMLLYCFVVVLLTGGFLAFFFEPSGGTVVYDGAYEPLRGTFMPAGFASMITLSYDVRGGLFIRQLHHTAAILLGLLAVCWVLIGRSRITFLALGLVSLGGLAGFGAADDLLTGTFLGRVPVPVWYGLHLLAALIVGAALVHSSREEAARQPRTAELVGLSLILTGLLLYVL